MGGHIPFDGLDNVRDLGGTPTADGRVIKDGLLFRGDQLYPATPTDLSKLCELGIKTVIDMRSQAECDEKPDPQVEGIRYLHLPIVTDVSAGITHDRKSDESIMDTLSSGAGVDEAFVNAYMSVFYMMFVDDEFAISQYARLIDEVVASAERGEGVLWHCTAGKDRSGFAAVILQEILGVDRDVIMADYLASNAFLANRVEGIMGEFEKALTSDAALNAARRFFTAEPEYLSVSYKAVDKLYGGFDGFLEQQIGVDVERRQYIVDLLTE